MKKIVILGSTGSIGTNTLSVIKKNPDKFSIHTLIANKNIEIMIKQCLEFRPIYACMINDHAAKILKKKLNVFGVNTIVLSGIKDAKKLISLEDVDIIMASIVGIDGLSLTIESLRSGKRVLLANKEALVTCGNIFIEEVRRNNSCLLPVDSEHNAIFQSLPESFQKKLGKTSLIEHGVSSIILTGSGGPFLNIPINELIKITPEQACSHKNWVMGKKISVDSATMMNKGLEYIEARFLFNASHKEIEILLHPQSIIHSMVRYFDGSIQAQLGLPDMRIPIAYSLSYPERIESGAKHLDFLHFNKLSFDVPDYSRYPCLKLAIEASVCGQAAITTLNASNEVAVSEFLRKNILFTEIAEINQRVLDQLVFKDPQSVEEVLYIDRKSREQTFLNIKKYKH